MKNSVTRKCLNSYCLCNLNQSACGKDSDFDYTLLSKGPQVTTVCRIARMKKQLFSTHFHAQNIIYSISHNDHTYLLRCLHWCSPALSCFFTNTVKFPFTILIPLMLGVDLRNLRFWRILNVFTTYCSRVSIDNNCSQVLSKSSKQPGHGKVGISTPTSTSWNKGVISSSSPLLSVLISV